MTEVKALYFECNMGAAGDMLMSALLELHPAPEDFVNRLNGLGIPGVKVRMDSVTKCGIKGTGVSVFVHGQEEDEHMHDHGHDHVREHHHENEPVHEHTHHHHTGMDEITAVINSLAVPEKVKEDAAAVYRLIAEAESHAHGRPVDQIHFHEVGTMDAVTDIVGVCWLIYELAPDKILASRIHVGSGHVRCAHGILPVPAPATAHILRGVPTYGGSVDGELCTPTGAALLRHFADDFVRDCAMSVEKTGYGMGKKHFYGENAAEILSAVRAFIGEIDGANGSIIELSCNLDDMTGEELGFAAERLIEEGALDVFTSPVYMKKNRPGELLTVLCREADRDKLVRLIFMHTTTLGIREYACLRHTLSRSELAVDTRYGSVRVKRAEGYGISRAKAEYEDLAAAARENGISIAEVRGEIEL